MPRTKVYSPSLEEKKQQKLGRPATTSLFILVYLRLAVTTRIVVFASKNFARFRSCAPKLARRRKIYNQPRLNTLENRDGSIEKSNHWANWMRRKKIWWALDLGRCEGKWNSKINSEFRIEMRKVPFMIPLVFSSFRNEWNAARTQRHGSLVTCNVFLMTFGNFNHINENYEPRNNAN